MQMQRILRKNRRIIPIYLGALLLIGIIVADQVWSEPSLPPYLTPIGPITDQQTVEESMASKVQAEQTAEAVYQAALNGPQGSKEPSTGPTPVPWNAGSQRTGIFDNTGPLLSGWGSKYDIVNKWRDFVGGMSTVAYSGALVEYNGFGVPSVPEQGMVIVKTTPPDPADANVNPAYDMYPSPYRCGPLRVISAQGPQLLLVSTTMPSWFRFDVSTRRWLNFGVIVGSHYVVVDPPCSIITPQPPPIKPEPLPLTPVPTVPPPIQITPTPPPNGEP